MNTDPQPAKNKRLQRNAVKKTQSKDIWLLFLLGTPFFLVGLFIVVIAIGLIPNLEDNIRAPRWVLGVAGGVFALAGLGIYISALRSLRFQRHHLATVARYPHEPALKDFPWDREGADSPRWKPFWKNLLAAMGMTIFLSVFNWWAFFSNDSPLMVKIIVGLFDLIAVFLYWKTLEAFIRGLKFGPSRLFWTGFPQKPEAVRFRWQPGTGLGGWTKASFTLRCIRETHTVVKTSKGSQKRVAHEEIWSQKDELGARAEYGLSGTVDLHFTVPDEIPGSAFQEESPIFWELEVRVDVPGVDFEHQYVVPVYR